MAIGRTFKEAFLKGVRSLELGKDGLLCSADVADEATECDEDETRAAQAAGGAERPPHVGAVRGARARLDGRDAARADEDRSVVPAAVRATSSSCAARRRWSSLRDMSSDLLRTLKRAGFGDPELAGILGVDEAAVREKRRLERASSPAYKRIDTCAAEFESFTPYMYGTYEPVCESEPTAEEEGRHPRQRPEPHRPGHRVRLLLLSRRLRLPRGGLRDGDGQLQPRDGLDRLRHGRPPVLRAADVRRRDGGHRQASASGGGDVVVRRAVRRPDAAEARAAAAGGGRRRSSARRRTRSTSPRIASDSRSCCGTSASRSRPAARRCRATKRARSRRASASRSSSARRTCSAAAAWRSSTTPATLDRYMTSAVDVSHDRPVLIDRFLEDAFEFDVDCVADARGAVVIGGIMEHIEEAGIHSGDSSCVVPPFMVAERHLGDDSRVHAAHRPGAEGRRPDERPVRDQGRHASTCSK